MNDQKHALHAFTRIGPSIFYPDVSISEVSKSNDAVPDAQHAVGAYEGAGQAPALIVLCTWMSAAPRHVAKYTAAYSTLFPSSAQLVLTTSLGDMLARSDSAQRSKLAPVLEKMQAAIQDKGTGRVLLHMFSHGGAHKACQLAIAWRARSASPLPIASIILDSTPGHGTYKRSLKAIRVSMPPSPVVRAVGVPLAHAYLATSWTLGTVFRIENVVQKLRTGLNDKDLFPLHV